MGDYFLWLVDRLLTESTLKIAHRMMDLDSGPSSMKSVQCRICHDEDDDMKMEAPCSCCGSLKYAHRICVQRWCNEKGDTTCEICHQQFQPGYTAPTPLFRYGGIPMHLRGNWEIPRRGFHNPGLIAMVSADSEFLDSDFDEYYLAPSPRSLMCCRIVAIIFIVLLVLRHTLPIIITGAGDYSVTLVTLLILRTAGILLPSYVMVKAFTTIKRRLHQQVPSFSVVTSDEENELVPPPRFVHIQ